MKYTSRAGFTILETMLFLGITGLLILGLVAGAGVGINIQRYRDSTESFKALLQQQYADLGSIENGRSNDRTCGTSARPTNAAINTDPGQSDCMIVGRYVRIVGSDISVYDVLAYQAATTVGSGLTDVQIMRSASYIYNTAAAPDQTKTMDWQTRISWPSPAGPEAVQNVNPRSLGLLIIRSPHSGQIYTFSSNTVPPVNAVSSSVLKTMMVQAEAVPGRAARIVCIASDGLFVSEDQSIYINANANGPSAIEVRSNNLLTGGARCSS